MEFVEGVSLEAYLKERGKLPASEVIPLGAAIANALSAAHEHGLAHHDVKPANVLLGKGGSIKVTDFGVSELLSAATKETDTICGTPGYIPPESLESGHYSARSDLFALGVVLYQCLTGKHPFLARSAYATLLKTFNAEPEELRFVAPEVPEVLSDLVRQLMMKDIEARPENAALVARALERMGEDFGLRWQPDFTGMDTAIVGSEGGVDSKFVTLTMDSQMTANFRVKGA
jgi:serine/threonine-protein kinase